MLEELSYRNITAVDPSSAFSCRVLAEAQMENAIFSDWIVIHVLGRSQPA
jgi:hypothetical protein